MSSVEHPYASFVHRVQKPSRYLGGEHGEVPKDWSAVDARVCLAFPDIYDIGMSHLGFKILYGILNAHPRIAAERAYAPWIDMEQELRARGEHVRSLESWRVLREFDVVGFSLQFELTYTNVLGMLDLGGIPLRSAARGEDDPLVIAGGPVATHAEPLAPFVDAMLVGDGEEKTPEIALAWTEWKKAGVPRTERLRRIGALGGWYVPSLYRTQLDPETGLHVVAGGDGPLPVRRAMVDLKQHPFPSGGPVAATETVFDRVSVEIARGCTEGCRFCQAGMIYRPVRERDPVEIAETIQKSVRDGGYDEASLTSLSTADYSAIHPLVKDVMKRLDGAKVSLSVSSLRAYGLTEDLLDEIQKVRATGLTFAPEAGSQRMRDVVNKNVTEAQLMETADRVFSRGWSKMKLYFMIGLPTEEDEDVLGIVQTGARALAVGRKHARGVKVTVSVSTFVPKPHTPFQWCAMDGRQTVLRKQQILRDEARRTGVQLRMHDSEGSWLEGVLARGDRRLADVIETAYRGGARFDSWEEQLKLDVWEQAFVAHGIEPAIFLGTIPVTARLPWDHLDVGLEEGFLAREYRKALQNRLSPPCGKVVGAFVHATNLEHALAEKRRLVCYDCGVACDLTQMRDERLVFLRKLGAETPPVPVTERPKKAKPRTGTPAHAFDQGTPVRVRVGFTKLGRAAYSSHLDLVRLLPRIFRRLDVPLYYSQGFHPKPEMTFGPALSLGVASLGEWADVKIVGNQTVDLEGLAERLTGVSLEGVTFFAARVLGPNDPAVSRVIEEAEYVAGIPETVLDETAIAARIAERRASGDLRVRRNVDGIGKTIDVGAHLRDVIVGGDLGRDALARAGIAGRLVPVTLRIAITQSGSAKAQEAIEALLGDVPARIVRTALLARTPDGALVSPLECERLRRPRTSDAATDPAPPPSE